MKKFWPTGYSDSFYLFHTNRLFQQHRLAAKMPEFGSEVSDDFEFIETPAAPTPVPPPEDYGVRTTTVSGQQAMSMLSQSTHSVTVTQFSL